MSLWHICGIYDACVCFHINTDVWEKITQETKNTFLNILFCLNIKSLFQDHNMLCTENFLERFYYSALCLWAYMEYPFFVGSDCMSQLEVLISVPPPMLWSVSKVICLCSYCSCCGSKE